MGLLLFALLQRIPVVRGMLRRNRVLVRLSSDMTVSIQPYKLAPDRNVTWGKKENEKKTNVERNFHYMQENGLPVDFCVENKKNTLNLVEENPATQEDADTAALCNSFKQMGEMIERRKHKSSIKDKMIMLMVIFSLIASLGALAQFMLYRYQTMPEVLAQVDGRVEAAVGRAIASAKSPVLPVAGGTEIVVPEG